MSDAARRVIDRLRAGLRLVQPDHLTPMGARILERILDEEDDRLGDDER